MKGVFADTSYFVALLNSRDSVHEQATSFARSFTGKLVTSDFVLIELANFLSSSNRRSEFPSLVADSVGAQASRLSRARASCSIRR